MALSGPIASVLASAFAFALVVACIPAAAFAQQNVQGPPAVLAPDLAPLLADRGSEFRPIVERYTSDRGALTRRYRVGYSPAQQAVMTKFYATWSDKLKAIDFNALSPDARADYVLLRGAIEHEQTLLARDAKVWADVSTLIPFADTIMALEETRREMIPVDPAKAAKALDNITAEVAIARTKIESIVRGGADMPAAPLPSRIAAYRATEVLNSLHGTLQAWYKFYEGYDPLFSWWTLTPYRGADTSIVAYSRVLRERVVGWHRGEDEPIVGLPIGRDGVTADLRHEMIAYTPEELMAIAQRELEWGETEMKKASREMGFGDDWKKALEKVKETYVPPGDQINLVRDLEFEGLDFVKKHDLITIPPLAQDIWRIEMLTPEQQKVSPFFLGGEILQVSYPTDSMSDADKMMSMRGNNPHFSHATVFHEMIPGHELQGFMNQRYYPYRQAFATPFWTEGGAFYWETIFWDLGYQSKPEDRIGALFWRMHRAARIIFSLNFHLGNWTPQQCIEFLIDRVGHERANATAEVRRSFNGSYGPLYQVAYMMGGLEFRALHHEVVDAGKMTNRQFHDFIYTHGTMPVEMVRNLMLKQPLTRDYTAQWKFGAMIPPPGGGK
jgi:uncharacterized protein (DUF885 family)